MAQNSSSAMNQAEAMLKNLMNNDSVSDGMSNFFQDLAKEDKSRRGQRQKPRKNKQRQQNNKQAKQELEKVRAIDAALEKQSREHREAILQLEEQLMEQNAIISRMSLKKQASGNSILPNDIDEIAKLFIMSDIIGKPPPGLS